MVKLEVKKADSFNKKMKKNELKTEHELTPKQRMFVEILVQEHGNITQAEALKRAGYESKSVETARSHASQLLNRKVNPHIAKYYDKRFDQEVKKYESDNLRRYKRLERKAKGGISKRKTNRFI